MQLILPVPQSYQAIPIPILTPVYFKFYSHFRPGLKICSHSHRLAISSRLAVRSRIDKHDSDDRMTGYHTSTQTGPCTRGS